MIAFVGLIIVVIGLIHFYLWKRLVKDPFRPGRVRKVGAVVAVALAVLVPATLIGVRSGYLEWLAWPGYMWVALMFYLLVTLAVLEIPRLVINLWIRATSKRSAAGKTGSPATVNAAVTSSGADAGGAISTVGSVSSVRTTDSSSAASPGGPADAPDTPAGTAGRAGSPAVDTAPTTDEAGSTSAATPPLATPDSGGSTLSSSDDPDTKAESDAQLLINRRLLLARGAAIFAGLTAAGITGYGARTALGAPQLDRVQLPMAKLPRAMDGTRLAVVSDIHLGPLAGTSHAARIVGLINSVNADIVCIVGDLVDGSVAELGSSAAPLSGIKSRRGAYFVTGNHEYYSGHQEWVAEVARLGIRPLRNERLEIDGLDLAGVNDIGGVEFEDGPDLQRALGDRDAKRPVVLMAHQPVVARDAAPFGVDLQVSGHTHGGQMAPFNLLVQLEQPVVSGLGKVDGVPVYVTNGAGFWGPPVRVGAPPQVTVIELRTP